MRALRHVRPAAAHLKAAIQIPSPQGRHVWLVLLACLAAVFAGAARSVPERSSWPPISAEDAAMKDCPRQPGAPAVILYREENSEVDEGMTTVFKRLKVLTPAGRDRAAIEIPFVAGVTKVTGIEARVVSPEGSEKAFDGEIFEKTALRRGRLRLAVKTFALPNVEVGSIIDYRYRLVHGLSNRSAERLNALIADLTAQEDRPEEGGAKERRNPRTVPVGRWPVQEGLFTKHLKLSYKNDTASIANLLGAGGRLAWASVGMEFGKPLVFGGNAVLELYNIPAFVPEARMIPEKIARMSIDLFFLDREIMNGEEFWKLESQDWQNGVEEFIGRPAPLAARAREIVGGATEPLDQLQRIYVEVQRYRNLSYEYDLTDEEIKEQKIKENRRVEDVLERRYGLRSDITRTFVKLAQAAGFEAEVARVASRDDKLFRKDLLTFYDQLDSEIALVKVSDKTLVLDPATPYCPFGLVHWSRTNTTGLRFSDDPPAFFITPSSPPDLALTRREAAFVLNLAGDLAGTIETIYSGQEALVRRLGLARDDPADRRQALEKELTGILPPGAGVTLTKLENVDNNAPALIAAFDVSVPGFAAVAGDKVVLPAFPLIGTAQYPFSYAERKFPVYFPYPYHEFDDIVITLAENLSVEARPAAFRCGADAYSYALACVDEGPQRLHAKRDLVMRKFHYPVGEYRALKGFFEEVRAADEAQIVLRAAKK